MPIKIRVSNKTANFLNLVGSFVLGAASLYVAIFSLSIPRQESVFLALAGVAHFFAFVKIYRNEIIFSSGSLSAIIWAIPTIYSILMIVTYSS